MEQTVSLNVVETSCNNGLVVRRSWNGNVGELWGLERKQTEGMMSLQILKWNTVTSREWSGILPTQFLELWNNYSNSVWYLGRTVCHFLFKYFCKWELTFLCVLERHTSSSTEKLVCGNARLYCFCCQFLYQAWVCNFWIILQYEIRAYYYYF